MNSYLRLIAVVVVLLVGAVGCATTSITSIASPGAPSYSTGHILVVAAYSDLRWRTEVETGLQSQHPAFIASVRTLEVSSINDPEAIVSHAVSDPTIEAILLLARSGAGLSLSFMASEYYVGTITKPWANTSATLYDVVDDKIVWQADASTAGNAYASWSDIRSSFIGKVVDQLRADGLLTEGQRARRSRTLAEGRTGTTEVAWSRPPPSAADVITLAADDLNLLGDANSLVERALAGVVRLEGERGLGTAFLISRHGLALTNYHVVRGQSGLSARFGDGHVGAVRVLRVDERADIALVEIKCSADCYTIPVGSERDVGTGSDIYAVGNPAGLSASLSRGIVSGIRRGDSITLLQVDAALNAGNSGGPIIDMASGKVVAVVSFKLSQAEGIGFGVAIDDALRVVGVRLRSF